MYISDIKNSIQFKNLEKLLYQKTYEQVYIPHSAVTDLAVKSIRLLAYVTFSYDLAAE